VIKGELYTGDNSLRPILEKYLDDRFIIVSKRR